MTEAQSTNPVHKLEDGWWFYNETWSELYGPYPSEEECNKACTEYAKTL